LNDPKTYTSELTDLQDNTTYYIRPYVIYSNGVVYGTKKTIKTLKIENPQVSIAEVTNITRTSATGGGNVLSNGGLAVTTRGVCWNITGNPTLENSTGHTIDGNGTGTFASELTGLIENTTYYVAAYATNEKDTGYSEVKSFTTLEFTLPIVETVVISNITFNSAESGGNVISDGGFSVTARGVCWNTSGNPTLENNTGYTTDGIGAGNFISTLINLTDNTNYFVVAYATNEKGTSYGEVKTFTTLELMFPVVETAVITNITYTSATGGGNVVSDGNGTVTVRGICWNTAGNPTLESSIGHTIDSNGTGVFTSELTSLTGNTNYYVAAYATNEKGTAYGQVEEFTTLIPCGQLNIDYQGQIYHTVEIGSQCWMKENLNYETGNSWCYDDDPANCDVYGRLYDWATIMNGASSSNEVPSGVQGICPDGWHIPSDAEWDVLVIYLGGSNIAGYKMKSTSGWNNDGNGDNSSGFAAFPGGYRNTGGDYSGLDFNGYWWTATENNAADAWRRGLYYSSDGVFRYNYNKSYGFSVRCVRD
jgi:uncharacterized protein (TIGR02145 family)